ncbi:MAG: single-stranded DNA-binding protein [Candidatus Abyssobacteria bacterium SURF_5]|uniref:Single-stranded DNA-binding protein n=1 Tax=Abyssobacteria bacterium (strain SURF_5) TaxID=2093360 RepID=A0A3A4NNA0_ABYX5|nr:MAG: single-stranded DNA-binding protein [Candidatus Abyssubacteria bacterium SURF_5]
MIELNKVFLAGRLTQDPELRYIPSGVAVSTLRMAVNTTFFPRDGEKKEEVLYIDVIVWRKQAEAAVQYLHKGSPVFVEGRLQSRRWETQDGQKRTSIEVQADRVQYMEWAGEKSRPQEGAGSQQASPDQNDDIPF